MKGNILTYRLLRKEPVVAVILVAACLSVYGPTMAEYAATAPAGGIAKESSFGKESVDVLKAEWSAIESVYFTISHKPAANLKKVERKLRQRRFYVSGEMKRPSSSAVEEKIAYRMDILFNKAKDVLNMKPRVEKINVMVFKNRRELNNEYYKIFKDKRDIVSFYVFKHNTIYTNESDISDTVMAHEMGHAIVDHYFVMRPPERIREVLSKYVDEHLDD